jgi:hypothetical protein
MKPYNKGFTTQERQQPETRGTKSGDEMLLLQTQEDILNAIIKRYNADLVQQGSSTTHQFKNIVTK